MARKKIALVGFRLNKGGAEKVMATLSNYFYKEGIETHIIIIIDDIMYEHSGTVVNLGKLKNESNGVINKLKRFNFLRKYLKTQNFDYIIDFRFRPKILQEFLISKWLYPLKKTIYTVHSSKLNVYMPNSSTLTKTIYGNCYKIVSITNTMRLLIEEKYQLNNIITIYNPIDTHSIQKEAKESINFDFKYIIAVGEYETNIKQFDKLIKAYSESKLPQKKIALIIIGTGKQLDYLKSIAKANNVEKLVHFLGFKKNPFKYMETAEFLVMSSKYEGFGMVITEALASGSPVIAFDCPTGPNEIIKDGFNGLLIENQNFKKLTIGMDLLVEDKELYAYCKQNTLMSIKKFSIDRIGKQWLKLMNIE